MSELISRRKMLGVSGLALMGTMLAGCGSSSTGKSSDTKPAKRPFKICLNTSTIRGYNLPVEKQIELCATAGFEGIELWVRDVEKYLQNGGTPEGIVELLKAEGLSLENMIGFAPWMASDEGMEQMKKEIDLSARLGSRCIAATASGIKELDKANLQQYSERFRQVLEYGEQVNVWPMLELWGAGVINQISDATSIAIGARHPKATMLLDFYHIYRGGNSFESLHLINGRQLPVFHINDYPPEPSREQLKDADRVYPGDGICPFNELIPLLYDSGFRGAFSLELFNPEYWKNPDVNAVLKTGYDKTVGVIDRALKF